MISTMRRLTATLPRHALQPQSSRYGASAATAASQRLSCLFSKCGSADYIGEPVSIEAHSLQAAALAAKETPNDREVIAAALLHDVGHMLGLEAGQRMGMDG